MEAVGDFTIEDKIFPGIPWDSLLFEGTELLRLHQKNYSVLMHLPPVSHTGHSPNIASGGVPSLSTFESDAEAPSQVVTPLVTPPCHPPDSRDGKKSHHYCSPKGEVLPEKKDEAKCKDSDSTSSKKSQGDRGRKHGSSKDGTTSPLKVTLDQTDSPSQRRQ